MRRLASNRSALQAREFRLLAGALRAEGYRPADFELLEDTAPDLSRLLGLPDHLLTMRRKSTGDERLYTIQPGRPWLSKAFADLRAGFFGPATAS